MIENSGFTLMGFLIYDIDNQMATRESWIVPTVMRQGPYRFHFFSNEGTEPPHIHVRAHGKRAKYWLLPVALAYGGGFSAHELDKIERTIHEHQDELLQAWLDRN